MNTRRRRCVEPKAKAGMLCHSASYPMLANSPRTHPMGACSPSFGGASNPGTFSTSTNRGRSRRTTRANSHHRPDRSPASPSRFPARLRSWQGNPPAMRSTPHSPLAGGKVRMSSHFGTLGQCFCRTRLAYSSISTCHLHVRPARSNPKSIPPTPANREPNVITVSLSRQITK